MPFQTKITRARFVLGRFSSEQMQAIGQVGADSIIDRIRSGKNANDAPSKPLSMKYREKKYPNGRIRFGADQGYRAYKVKRGLPPVRDWKLTGWTLGSLKVKSASENRVVVGFINSRADTVAHINNQRERAFGLSPNDNRGLRSAVAATAKQVRVVRTVKVA